MINYKFISLEELRKKISNQMRKNRDKAVREKVALFYLAHQLKDVQEACARRGVSRDYYYRWWKRFKAHGFKIDFLKPVSRRPKNSPKKISILTEGRIITLRRTRGLGPQQISWHLKREGCVVSASTVQHVISKRRSRTLPKKPKLKAHNKRYELPIPGQRVQMDVKYSPKLLDGQKTYVYVAIDECTRWRFAKAFTKCNALNTLAFADELLRRSPFPIQVIQTDNGAEFTNRLQPELKKRGMGLHPMELWCKERKIRHRLIPPGEKEINGKVERSHRIDEEYFYHRSKYQSIEGFNNALSRWIDVYNTQRPHGGLKGITPFEKLEERVLKLPFEEVEERWLYAKNKFLREFPLHHNPAQQLIAELQKELVLYNDFIQGT